MFYNEIIDGRYYYGTKIFNRTIFKKTGTTIRTLHYYDEIGLLNPEVSASGRRFYNEHHLIILQKIITLKFLSYSLDQIKQFLEDESWDLYESLSLQREMMLQKRNQLNYIIKALDHALHIVDGEDLATIIKIANDVELEDDPFPNPLSPEEEKWLSQAMEHLDNTKIRGDEKYE